MTFDARRRWLLLWLVLAAVLAVRATKRLDHRGVLLDHLEFGRRLLAGTDVYADWRSDLDAPLRPLHAPYPPSFGLMTAPFTVVADHLGLPAARLAWVLVQLLALVGIAAALRSLVARPGGPPDPGAERAHRWRLLATLVLMSRFVLRDTHGGGGNLINVALCTLSFLAAERQRQGPAGWLLGFSLATKPTQVWLVPMLWLLGSRRAAVHAVVAAGAFAFASLALLHFDAGPWLRWLDGSLQLARQTDAFAVPALGFPEFEWMNQSLRCATARWFGSVPDEIGARVALLPPRGLGLSPLVAAWAARAVLGAAVLLVVAAALRCRAVRALGRAFVFAATLVLSLLASPLTWKAHHVALLPLVYLLIAAAVRRRSRALWVLLGAFVATCAIGQEILGDAGDELLNSLYLLPAFDLALLGVAVRMAFAGAAPDDPTIPMEPPPAAAGAEVATQVPPR